MKKLLVLFSAMIVVSGCQQSSNSDTPPTTTTTPVTTADYYAEYGIPDQNLIQPCSGERELVRPITKCTKRSTNASINISLCYNLTPIFMTIPSPAGQKQTNVTGGVKLDTCEEGSTTITATAYSCNAGYIFLNNRCQSYSSVGSYAIQKDQIYHNQGGLKILFTVGHDYSVQEKDGLKLFMLTE